MSDLLERLDHRCRLDVTDNGIEIHLDQSDPDCQEAAARIRELEALVTEYFNADGRTVAERLLERAEKAERERDAIEAATIERCAKINDDAAESLRQDLKRYSRAGYLALVDAAQAIRALAKLPPVR